ncbi:hypothetical protein [Burkholderia sp. BE17]|uniref:hypothetical protein n=1 Tax=Burkholderia sp. BE17 TaxID=2656644 RepID=UPI00187B9F1A|nr:hypothetical protein [Burkholderia sp. BE17]
MPDWLPRPIPPADEIRLHRVCCAWMQRKKKKPRKSKNLRGFVTAFGGDGDRQNRMQRHPTQPNYSFNFQYIAPSNDPIYPIAIQPHPALADGLNDGPKERC